MSPLAAVSSATCSTDLVTVRTMLYDAARTWQEPPNLFSQSHAYCADASNLEAKLHGSSRAASHASGLGFRV